MEEDILIVLAVGAIVCFTLPVLERIVSWQMRRVHRKKLPEPRRRERVIDFEKEVYEE